MKRHSVRQSSQLGVSLIEVLVALLVLAVGLLGVLVMQARGLQFNQNGFYQSQAMFMAEDIVERMRANQVAVDDYAIDFGDAGTPGSGFCDTTCTTDDMAASDLLQWKTDLSDVLPAGDGRVVIGAAVDNLQPVTIQVRFTQGDQFTYQMDTTL